MKTIALDGNSLRHSAMDELAHRRARLRLASAAERRFTTALGLVRNNAVLYCVATITGSMNDDHQK
jgi:hypothetical protein